VKLNFNLDYSLHHICRECSADGRLLGRSKLTSCYDFVCRKSCSCGDHALSHCSPRASPTLITPPSPLATYFHCHLSSNTETLITRATGPAPALVRLLPAAADAFRSHHCRESCSCGDHALSHYSPRASPTLILPRSPRHVFPLPPRPQNSLTYIEPLHKQRSPSDKQANTTAH
jgi:hypothetical protein